MFQLSIHLLALPDFLLKVLTLLTAFPLLLLPISLKCNMVVYKVGLIRGSGLWVGGILVVGGLVAGGGAVLGMAAADIGGAE